VGLAKIPDLPFDQYTQLTPAGKINYFARLDPNLKLDLGDLDSDPTTQHRHGTMVIENFVYAPLKFNNNNASVPLEDVPLIFPLKFHNFYDQTSLPFFSTEYAGLVESFEKVSPRVINMSGAFGSRDEENYRPLRDYLKNHSDVTFVAAMGDQCHYLGGSCKVPPFPSTLTDTDGKRLPNLVNVGVAKAENGQELIITSNYLEGLVDVFVISDNLATSYAAPRISRLLVHAQTKHKDCFKNQSPRNFLKRISQYEAHGSDGFNGIPVTGPAVKLEELTSEDILAACQ
jgi:hypothetical protein